MHRPIDFELLLRREITPPFLPEVESETDCKYVPKTYLQAEVKDSIVEDGQAMSKSQKSKTNMDFKEFAYHEDASMNDF